MAKKSSTPTEGNGIAPVTRVVIVHGDKGGVGKSMVAQAIADYLLCHGGQVAVIDADTANPDVSRMFGGVVPVCQANMRSQNGWMDVMDFVVAHAGHTIVLNTPAGIGEAMKDDMQSFTQFLTDQDVPVEMELWWAMNSQHDSVNLLSKALTEYGSCFGRLRVVCNMHFANGDPGPDGPFCLWFESPLRTRIEKAGGMTIMFPGLHVRVVAKLATPGTCMPFSLAVDAATGEALHFGSSERWKLKQWIDAVDAAFTPAFANAAISVGESEAAA